jgi:hypothetical protein
MCNCTTTVYSCDHKYLVVHSCPYNNKLICRPPHLKMNRVREYYECKMCMDAMDMPGTTRGATEREEQAQIPSTGGAAEEQSQIPTTSGAAGERSEMPRRNSGLDVLANAALLETQMEEKSKSKEKGKGKEEGNQAGYGFSGEEGEIRESIGSDMEDMKPWEEERLELGAQPAYDVLDREISSVESDIKELEKRLEEQLTAFHKETGGMNTDGGNIPLGGSESDHRMSG